MFSETIASSFDVDHHGVMQQTVSLTIEITPLKDGIGLLFRPLTGGKANTKNCPMIWIFTQILIGLDHDNTKGIFHDSLTKSRWDEPLTDCPAAQSESQNGPQLSHLSSEPDETARVAHRARSSRLNRYRDHLLKRVWLLVSEFNLRQHDFDVAL